jgi:OmpA-OmpF porin, OOP family
MSNIVEQLKNAISPDMLKTLAAELHAPAESISKTLDGIFPGLIGHIAKIGDNATNSGVMNQLMDILKSDIPPINDIIHNPSNLKNMFSDSGSLGQKAEKFSSLIFGDKLNDFTSAIANYGNIEKNSASSLIKVASIAVIAFLAKFVKQNPTSPAALLSLLYSQKNNIISAIPKSLLAPLGLDKFASSSNKMENNKADTHVAKPHKHSIITNIILGIIIVGMAMLLLRHCSNKHVEQNNPTINHANQTLADSMYDTKPQLAAEPTQQSADEIKQTADSTSDPIKETASNLSTNYDGMTTLILPNNVKLTIPENSTENKLLAIIKDDKPVATDNWLSLDRLGFNTGSITLSPASQQQLANIAQILNAYPKVKLLIGGYTDNVGQNDDNLILSHQRANIVKNSLTNLGIASDRLQVKGYGNSHAIESNNTEDGRAHNRRIDILVTDK